jgi:hypothetical protein
MPNFHVLVAARLAKSFSVIFASESSAISGCTAANRTTLACKITVLKWCELRSSEHAQQKSYGLATSTLRNWRTIVTANVYTIIAMSVETSIV